MFQKSSFALDVPHVMVIFFLIINIQVIAYTTQRTETVVPKITINEACINAAMVDALLPELLGKRTKQAVQICAYCETSIHCTGVCCNECRC